MPAQFARYLKSVLDSGDSYTKQKYLAAELRISASFLSRILSGKQAYTFSVNNCLRVARALHRPPAEVLRAAGKTEMAELLESLYEGAGRPTLTSAEDRLLTYFRSVPAESRQTILELARAISAASDGPREHPSDDPASAATADDATDAPADTSRATPAHRKTKQN